ncbi:MAG: carboxylating nicotinate-nucleotide diphosphorylase [Oscillospiraceae bacterium]|nr:carboxylating nicotinate-nucleotide diphosphorylase [Oscillospiraceae bacterium]
MNELIHPGLDGFLKTVLDEDIGTGDVTALSCVSESAVSKGAFIAKEPGIISGMSVLTRVFELLDSAVLVTAHKNDGDSVKGGDIIAEISGPSRAILTGERTALNLLQHMSGIATRTAEAVGEIKDTKTKILDTRKTTPGMRVLDKYAVTCGGGVNHRLNLADAVLIKDNHIKAAGGITNAVSKARSAMTDSFASPEETGSELKDKTVFTKNGALTGFVEVETESLCQVKEALAAGADIIMLDNMPPEMMAEAVRLVNGKALTEASGNMGERDLRTIANTGVDFISIGALTHSVKAMDISLRFE